MIEIMIRMIMMKTTIRANFYYALTICRALLSLTDLDSFNHIAYSSLYLIRPNSIWNKIICKINKWLASSMVSFPLE